MGCWKNTGQRKGGVGAESSVTALSQLCVLLGTASLRTLISSPKKLGKGLRNPSYEASGCGRDGVSHTQATLLLENFTGIWKAQSSHLCLFPLRRNVDIF